jgi:hypothetical protein
MHFCDGFMVNRQQSGLHVAERGGSSSTHEPGRVVDMAALGNDLADNVEPRVVCEVSSCAFVIRTILPLSGVMVLYYCLKRTGLAPVRDVAV